MKIKCGEEVGDFEGLSFKKFCLFARQHELRFCSWENGSWIEAYPKEDQSTSELFNQLR
ncbi:U exon [Bat mastadenovirus WIV10]|uniref:U exon n=3 Tax=Bat mastadenovirus C TaxID=2015370 RepID=A0A161DIL3_9ADEN|nr:U exon [Bat mastadenovirus WIV9]YP_009246399.1 U exon [Bat mastadenovirus WIV10]YP_009246438.1 U exon [Bat mastadenovirus WIV11]AMB43068.1 U exon [Bat mastadenovirus WIV9]AMB43101.1 U exon [Bat mastadenovirus WIV10]AMB43134.1 U exon [Bat mastadenovirus WIV11]